MRFKQGQEITPRKDSRLIVWGKQLQESEKPVFGRVYTVALYPFGDDPCHMKHKYLLLSEIGTALFNEDSFEPVITTDELEQDLLEAFLLDKKLSDG